MLTLLLLGCTPDKEPTPAPDTSADTGLPDDTDTDTTEERVDHDRDGYSVDEGDCDDENRQVNPGVTESCDDVDEDCNGVVDDIVEWVSGALARYVDGDGDGYGSGRPVYTCEEISGYTQLTGDCDDANVDVHPRRSELCNGVDDDCDGDIDQPSADECVWGYADADGDGLGGAGAFCSCEPDPDFPATESADCDDGNAALGACPGPHILGTSEARASLGDRDGDGALEVFVVGDTTGEIELPDAGEAEAAAIALTTLTYDGELALGDVDGDGVLDAVWTQTEYTHDSHGGSGTTDFSYSPGPLDGTLVATATRHWEGDWLSMAPIAVAALGEDLDADGVADILYAEGGETDLPYMWLIPADALGEVTDDATTPLGPNWGYVSTLVSPGDVDGDGVPDVISDGWYVTFAAGPLTPAPPNYLLSVNEYLAHGDLDGDGAVDLVSLGGLTAYISPLPTEDTEVADIATSSVEAPGWEGGWYSAAIADFDSDGTADLALGAPDARVDAEGIGGVYLYRGGPRGSLRYEDADTHLGGGTSAEDFGWALVAVEEESGVRLAVSDASGVWFLTGF